MRLAAVGMSGNTPKLRFVACDAPHQYRPHARQPLFILISLFIFTVLLKYSILIGSPSAWAGARTNAALPSAAVPYDQPLELPALRQHGQPPTLLAAGQRAIALPAVQSGDDGGQVGWLWTAAYRNPAKEP